MKIFALISFITILTNSLGIASVYNPKVEILQRNLSLLNYEPGPTDGFWGNKTKKSYYLFLNENGFLIPEDHKSFSINDLIKVRLNNIKANLKKVKHLNRPLTIRDASHLLRRTGFGAHPYEVNGLLNLSRAEGIVKILSGLQKKEIVVLPQFVEGKIPPYFMGWTIDGFKQLTDGNKEQLKQWWLNKMITTSVPQLEKLTLFWHNHFVSSYRGVDRDNFALFRQNQKFREFGFTNFKLLTKIMLSDKALLKYLDNDKNEKGSPNENLARELLELFTLGEGNYSEKTIKEASRILTGFSFNGINGNPFFQIHEHDQGNKTIFDKTGNFKPDDLVEIIFEQPSASTFLTSKFWKLYISELNPPNEELNFISNKFKESDYDLLILISEILGSKSFWKEENRGTIIKSPIDLIVGTSRSTGYVTKQSHLFSDKIASMGQNLFEHPNVAGWVGGGDWINSTRLVVREQEINSFVKSFEEIKELKLKERVDIKSNLKELSFDKDNSLNINVEDITFKSKKAWSNNFDPKNNKGGINLVLGSPKLKNHYSRQIRFEMKYRMGEKPKIGFCIQSPYTISYFYEEFADYNEPALSKLPREKSVEIFGLCYHTRSFKNKTTEFQKIIQSMSKQDISRLRLVCEFIGSKKRKNWFEKSKIPIAHENAEAFLKKSETASKVDELSKWCTDIIDVYIKSSDNVIPLVKQEEFNETYAKNELVLDTVRLRWVKKKKNDRYINLSLGISDITFNKIKKSGMMLEFLIYSNPRNINHKYSLKFRKQSCDDGCFSRSYLNSSSNDFYNPNIFFTIDRNNHDFFKLDKEDRKYVAALWLSLPKLIDYAEKMVEENDGGGEDILVKLKTWNQDLDRFKEIVLRSPFEGYVSNLKLTIKEENFAKSPTINNSMMNMIVPKTLELSNEISSKNLDDFLAKLEDSNSNIRDNLSHLLLSIKPLTNDNGNISLREIFFDPTFQLK